MPDLVAASKPGGTGDNYFPNSKFRTVGGDQRPIGLSSLLGTPRFRSGPVGAILEESWGHTNANACVRRDERVYVGRNADVRVDGSKRLHLTFTTFNTSTDPKCRSNSFEILSVAGFIGQ